MGPGTAWRDWGTVAACLVTRMVSVGSAFNLAVLYDSVREDFGVSHSATGLVFALASFVACAVGFGTNALLLRASEAALVFAGGLVATAGFLLAQSTQSFPLFLLGVSVLNGLGQGLAYIVGTVAASSALPAERRHVALSLSNLGNAVAVFAWPSGLEALRAALGWRSALGALAAASALLCPAALLLRHPRVEAAAEQRRLSAETEDQSPKGSRPRSIWRLAVFQKLALGAVLMSFAKAIVMTFGFSHMVGLGLEASEAVWVFRAQALGSVPSRLSVSLLDNSVWWLQRWGVFVGAHVLVVLGDAAVAWESSARLWPFVAAFGVFGAANGLIDPLTCLVAGDLVGAERLGQSYSALIGCWGVGSLGGTLVGGALRDALQSARLPLALGTVAAASSAALLATLRPDARQKTQ